MNLRAVEPGDVIPLSKTSLVRPFRTMHRVPSQGYAVYSVSVPSLKPQYRHLGSHLISGLVQQGVEVRETVQERLEVVYTGDTSMRGLLLPENAFVFGAPLLILEATYLDGDRSKAHVSDQ